MFFASKQQHIEQLLVEYAQKVRDSVALMKLGIEAYCRENNRIELQANFIQVHAAESKADDIRRDIEVTMYTKSLFPESRGDILGLLEAIDKVPNQAESITRMLLTHHLIIPPAVQTSVLDLVDLGRRCVEALLESAAYLFRDFTNALTAIGKIDQLESEADRVEAALIDRIFGAAPEEITDLQKILLRDLVKNIANLCDRSESAADRIRITVAKRKI